MPNMWIEHVKKFAKENGLSYGCAMSKPNLKDGYVPSVKMTSKEKKQKKVDDMNKTIVSSLLKRIKNMTSEDRPLVLMKYNAASQPIRDTIKEQYPKYYNKLFNK